MIDWWIFFIYTMVSYLLFSTALLATILSHIYVHLDLKYIRVYIWCILVFTLINVRCVSNVQYMYYFACPRCLWYSFNLNLVVSRIYYHILHYLLKEREIYLFDNSLTINNRRRFRSSILLFNKRIITIRTSGKAKNNLAYHAKTNNNPCAQE